MPYDCQPYGVSISGYPCAHKEVIEKVSKVYKAAVRVHTIGGYSKIPRIYLLQT